MAVTLRVIPTTQGPAAAVPAALTFEQPRVVIGRGAHADLRLPSLAVSDTHAVVHAEHGDLAITDDASTNGTAVNGTTLVRGRRKVLRAGDRIAVPGFEIVVEPSLAPADPPERTATLARRLLADAIVAAGGEAAPPELELVSGRRAGKRWRFGAAPSVLVAGRGETCEIVLDDADCSRQHAEFGREPEGVTVRDLGSKNGVVVGERKVTERRLRHGDEVRVGRSVLRYHDPTEELLRAFEAGPDEPAPVLPPVAPTPPLEESATTTAVDANGAEGATDVPTAEPVAAASGPLEPRAPSVAPARPSATAVLSNKRPARTIDGIVIALAVLILAVSVVALWFLLRGTPAPPPR